MKNYFPDKEKDYQFTTEIPELKIPADLAENTVEPLPTALNESIDDEELEEDDNSLDVKETVEVELLEPSGGVSKIRIEDGMERSWRIVGKALSTHSIEITNRSQAESVYYVQYDADFKEIQDGSLWDEVLFIFGADPAKEQALKVALTGNKSLTELMVLNSDNQPLSEGAGLKLLQLLYKSIKADLADTE